MIDSVAKLDQRVRELERESLVVYTLLMYLAEKQGLMEVKAIVERTLYNGNQREKDSQTPDSPA